MEKKSKTGKRGGRFVILILFIAAACYVGIHYFQSFRIEKASEVESAAKHILQEQVETTASFVHYKTVYKDSYAASILYNQDKRKFSVMLFECDRIWRNRYQFAGGCLDAEYGKLISSNSASHGTGVIVVGGFELPSEASYYKLSNSGVTYSCDIDDREVLKIFITDNPYDINGIPQMYNGADEVVQ